MRGKLVVLVSALAFAGCNNPTAPDIDTGTILLEIEYINYAWAPTFFGFYVDNTGDVYSYNRRGTQWPHDGDRVITEEQLAEKVSLERTLVATRDSIEVVSIANRIAEVNPGQLSQQKFQCADAGTLKYRAYSYNPIRRTYQPILLRAEGDLAQQNTSEAALELVSYIRSLGLVQETPGCDP